MSIIETECMYEDLRTDEVGIAINALRSIPKWIAEKYYLRNCLYEELNRQKYIMSAGTRSQFRMASGIGFSFLYQVPNKKRGRFKDYAGKLLRLVYFASARHYLEIRFGEVSQSQKGRPFAFFGEGDPRSYFHKVSGEVTLRSTD